MKYIVESDEQKKRYAKFLEDVSPEMLSFIKAASKAFGTIKRIEHEYPAPRKRGVRDT